MLYLLFSEEKHQKFINMFASITAVVGVVLAFGLLGFEAYIRWTLNQNFTFLGDGGLPALIVASFGLLYGLVYLRRRS